MYRFTNERCLNCGGEAPAEVTDIIDGDYYELQCPDCHTSIYTGVVTRNGERANIPPWVQMPSHIHRLPASRRFSIYEVWWTNKEYAIAVNGVCIAGNRQLYNDVAAIYDL